MNPDDADFWNDEKPGVPEDFDPDHGGDDGKVDDPFDLDNCCRSGCRGCEKAPPLARPEDERPSVSHRSTNGGDHEPPF